MNQSILVIALQGLGNSIINLPLISALKKKYMVKVLTFANGSSKFYNEILFENNITVPSVASIIKSRTKYQFDYAISMFPNYKREAAALIFSNSKLKLMPKLNTSLLHNLLPIKGISIDPNLHDLENNYFIIKEIQNDIQLDFTAIQTYFSTAHSLTPKMMNKLVVHPTASTYLKYYSANFWISLIDALPDFSEVNIICANNKFEHDFCSSIVKGIKPSENRKVFVLKGASFKDIGSLLLNTSLMIGLDSAKCHLSALLNIKTICLWSYADIKRIYPYGNQVSVYLPSEIMERATLKRANNDALKFIERANHSDIVEIYSGTKSIDERIDPIFSKSINLYYY